MAQYQVQGPDGLVHVFAGPDGATPDQVVAVAQQMFGAAHNAAAANTAQWASTINPVDGMSTTDRVFSGIGKAMTDVGRGVGQFIPGLESRQDVAASRAQDAPLMATTAGKVGDVLGNVAVAAPAAFIPGAGTLAGGAAIGGLMGLIQPSTSTGETLGNVGLGAAAGAAVPALVKGVQIIKAAAEPFYDAGKNAIVGRALNRAAGADAPAVAQRLAEAAQPFVGPSNTTPARSVMGELVPGSLPTVGQAAENPGVAALERAATAANPEVTNAVSQTMQAQNAARVGALQDIAGTGGARDFYAAARDATANDLYAQARAQGIDPAATTPEALQNMAQFAQRVPDAVLNRAKELAQINGDPMTNATSIQGLHYVKMAIDDLIGSADRAGNNTLKAAYTGLKNDLLTGMDNLSPAYQGARQTYAAMSRPINQMDVAQAIADKSINKLTGNLQPNAYANALTDTTAARATGLPSATLESTMDPAQMNRLQAVLSDVQRSNAAQNVGRGVGSDTVQKLAYSGLLDEAGIPGTRTAMRLLSGVPVIGRTGSAVDEAYSRASADLNNRLAQVMLDPGQAAQLMTMATPKQQSQMLKLLQRSAQVGALSAPASMNAQRIQ